MVTALIRTMLASLILLLSACSTLPSQPEGELALLVFPMHTSTAPGGKIWWDYQIFAENQDTGDRRPFYLRPTAGVDYQIVVLENGGTYNLNGWNSRSRYSNKVNNHNVDRTTTVKNGHLNIYPYRLVVRSNNDSQNRRFVTMQRTEQEALLEQILEDNPDMANWPYFQAGRPLGN